MIAPIAPSKSSRVEARLRNVAEKGKSVALDDLNARRELLAAARTLCHELETPMESIYRTAIMQPVLFMAIRIAIDLNLFEVMSKDESEPRTSIHLAELVKADPIILGRVLKQMAAMDFIEEISADTYELNDVSRSLLTPSHRDAFPFCFDVLGRSFQVTPQFLKETHYANPSNIKDTPLQLGHSTKKTFFEYLGSNDLQNAQFNNFMGLYANDRPRWLDPGHYPIERVLGEEASIKDDNDVLLVDVGGGKGHDLKLFKEKYPHLKGRMILQDLPFVIQQAGDMPQGLEKMPHNFFEPNPIKGARAYYFHSVLHGWPDEKCLEVLAAVKAAMKPGYSKLLINEIVIPNENAHPLSTSMDWVMMTVVAAEERTERNWDKLLAKAGLRKVKCWTFELGTESVIEAELDA